MDNLSRRDNVRKAVSLLRGVQVSYSSENTVLVSYYEKIISEIETLLLAELDRMVAREAREAEQKRLRQEDPEEVKRQEYYQFISEAP